MLTALRRICLAIILAATLAPIAARAVSMDLTNPGQTIDGWGTAQWRGANCQTCGSPIWSEALIDLLYDCAKGICLNMLRLGVASQDSPGEITGAAMTATFMDFDTGFNDSIYLARRIAQRQPNLKVFIEAWSANAACKSSGSINTGSFLTSCNAAWAATLVAAGNKFNAQMKDLNIPLYGIGTGNEPDFDTLGIYQCQTMTASAETAWAKIVCPAVHAMSPPPLCMVGSAAQWVNTFGNGVDYVGTCTADSACLAATDIWTTHVYGSPIGTVTAPGPLSGKKLYATEFSFIDASPSNNDLMTGTGGGIAYATVIHNTIVTGKVSAFVAWRAVSPATLQDDGLINSETTGAANSAISKRLYVLGNFSKYVKPGMIVYPMINSPPANVLVSSYKDPTSNNVVVIAINSNSTTTSLPVILDPTSKCRVMVPVVTDPGNNLAVQSPVVLSGETFTYPLSGSSVTSFVCNGSL